MSLYKQPRQSGGSYQMQAYPKVVNTKAKYRDPFYEEAEERPQNIMYDRRVVRGNTYAAMIIPNVEDTRASMRPAKGSTRKTKDQPMHEHVHREGTPEPVEGRKHISVDCIRGDDAILKPLELYDKPPDRAVDVQTDFYIDRPPTPRFMPSKNGVDVDTQIWDGDLFEFDVEVEPILQVVVGKTLEQARMEVLEEEELKAMKKHQQEFERLRDAELLDAQRLEEEERRREEEIRRRKQELSIVYEQKKLSHQKYVSRIISKAYLNKLKNKTFDQLRNLGYLADTSKLVVRGEVDHTLNENVLEANSFQDNLQSFTDELLQLVYQNLLDSANEGVNAYSQMRQSHFTEIDLNKQRKDEEKKRKKYEKERKEVEKQRENKLHFIRKNCADGIPAELDNISILDVFDTRSGLYTFGGSLTEVSLMLVAYEKYMSGQKQDVDISKDFVIDFLKKVMAYNGKADQMINGPSVEHAKVVQKFGSDSTPLSQIKDAFNVSEESGEALVDNLVELLAQSPSIKLYQEFAAELGLDFDSLMSKMSFLLKCALKDSDTVNNIANIESLRLQSFDNINSFVEITKPLNRNVWEYAEEFMADNKFEIPADNDEEAIKKIRDEYEAKHGVKGYRFVDTDNNIKLVSKDADNKTMYLHKNHLDNFRNFALNKLNDSSDEFHDIYKSWIKNVQDKFAKK